MSATAQLHERLMEVERTAREVSDAMQHVRASEIRNRELDALRRALQRLDDTRRAINARQKLEGRWAS